MHVPGPIPGGDFCFRIGGSDTFVYEVYDRCDDLGWPPVTATRAFTFASPESFGVGIGIRVTKYVSPAVADVLTGSDKICSGDGYFFKQGGESLL